MNKTNVRFLVIIFVVYLFISAAVLCFGEEVPNTTDIEQQYQQIKSTRGFEPNFRAYISRLKASEFLANQMIGQLEKAESQSLKSFMQFSSSPKKKKRKSILIAPAVKYYDGSVEMFNKPVRIQNLAEQERKILSDYYTEKLRSLTSQIAETGQGLAIAEPTFKETFNYVLVLPLLHTGEKQAINLDFLPRWLLKKRQLLEFSDSALLHFGRVYQAMMLAKKAAEKDQKQFSEIQYYKSAARKCKTAKTNIAVECLSRAMDCIDSNDADQKIAMEFKIIELWEKSGNFELAAGRAKQTFQTFGRHNLAGKALWLHYHTLSRANKANAILKDIDNAIDDQRCGEYKAKLMYIKWWALVRQRDNTGRIAAFEHKMLKEFGSDEIVAPVLLSRAGDLLSGQDYSGAAEAIETLLKKFPNSKAAKQAIKIKERLNKANKNVI